jgi:protein-S-isoprenylcysteine O-methyltransferase Ste14
MISLLLRNLIFTILQPGVIAGLVPYLILKSKGINGFDQSFELYHYIGALFFVVGFIIMAICIISFAINGRGTLSPVDPTKHLVVSGLYRFSRNPMYVGVIMILIGEAVFFRSMLLGIYFPTVLIVFNAFILFFEEPRLKKLFGDDYINYCKRVGRWV